MRSTNTPARTPATHNGTALKETQSKQLYYFIINLFTVDMNVSTVPDKTGISKGNKRTARGLNDDERYYYVV
jgi:hypothetical protein